jgi:hypothetical protein
MFLTFWKSLFSLEKRRRHSERMIALGRPYVVYVQGMLGFGLSMLAFTTLCDLLIDHRRTWPGPGIWILKSLYWAFLGWIVGMLNWRDSNRFLRSGKGLPPQLVNASQDSAAT